MARKPAKVSHAVINRIFKAAKATGLNVRIELPDGTVITTTGNAMSMGNDRGEPNEWDEALLDQELDEFKRRRGEG